MSRPRLALVLVPAAAIVLAACSSGTSGSPATDTSSAPSSVSSSGQSSAPSSELAALSATDLLAKASAAVAHTDVHVSGTAASDDQTVSLDMSYVGNDASGSMTMSGAKLTLLNVGGTTYFKADDAFWKTAAPSDADKIVAIVGDRWIKIDASAADFREMASIATRDFLTSEVLTPSGTITKGEPKTIDGVNCLTLTDTDPKEGNGVLYVDAADAKPIRIAPGEGGDAKGELDFDYSPEAIPAAPAASDVLDFSALQGGN